MDLDKHTPKPGRTDWGDWGLGRNCTLFARLGPEGKWAYREIRRYWEGTARVWYDRVLDKALEWNGDFPVPLPYNEVRYLARSVAKFTWKEFTPARFRAIQAERGKRGGIASGGARTEKSVWRKTVALELYSRGKDEREIAEVLGISLNAGRHYLSRKTLF